MALLSAILTIHSSVQTFQGIQYESVDVKKTSTVDYTSDDMSMDVNKVLYAAVRPHQETVAKEKVKDNQDPSVTSSTTASQQVTIPNETVCCYDHLCYQ